MKSTGGGGPVFVWLFSTVSLVLLVPAAVVTVFVQPATITGLGIVFIVGTALIHLAYFLALQQGYQKGDLSLVYPIARGLAPTLATVGAITLLGERPSPIVLVGVALVVVGVVLLALRQAGSGDAKSGVFYGVVTGLLISTYTVWDKYAVHELSLLPIVLQAGTGIGISIALIPYSVKRLSTVKTIWTQHRSSVIAVAVLAPTSYILVLIAMSFTPLSYVAPAREISILFATILGTKFLGEGDATRRLLAAACMVAGVIALALG